MAKKNSTSVRAEKIFETTPVDRIISDSSSSVTLIENRFYEGIQCYSFNPKHTIVAIAAGLDNVQEVMPGVIISVI